MPRGVNFGWGVCGIRLTLELSKLHPVKYVTMPFQHKDIGDAHHFRDLSALWVGKETIGMCHDGAQTLDHPLLQAIESKNLRPFYLEARAPKIVGYTFFETRFLDPVDVARANDYFDLIVGGSSWCEQILKDNGVTRTATVIQGIDGSLFHGHADEKDDAFKDRFVVFSGGKLELRKGQDIVIRAFKVLQDRHDDVILLNSWYNLWSDSLRTMQISPYIRFDIPNGDYLRAVNHFLHANGINPEKAVAVPPIPHSQMIHLYRNSDCGLFPNRCEGGTNLVLMEYMASGKPAIASFSSGHKDVLREDNAIPIMTMKQFTITNPEGKIIDKWDDPDLEETIEKLEWAYQNRGALKTIGQRAAESMKEQTWQRAAQNFLDLVMNG